jgi:hypothetical protein
MFRPNLAIMRRLLNYHICVVAIANLHCGSKCWQKAEAQVVPLHAMKALGGEEV